MIHLHVGAYSSSLFIIIIIRRRRRKRNTVLEYMMFPALGESLNQKH